VSGRGTLNVEARGEVSIVIQLGEAESSPAAGVLTVTEVSRKAIVVTKPRGFTLTPGVPIETKAESCRGLAYSK
jgi:hypothetical protein